MKTFKNETDAKKYGCNNLGKCETEIVLINNKEYLLAGTPMIEDYITEKFGKAFIKCLNVYTGKNETLENIFNNNDICNKFTDVFEEILQENYNLEILYSATEF